MPNVAWAPKGSDPVLMAITAPLGAELTFSDFLDRMAHRVNDLLLLEGIDQAQQIVRSLMPHDSEFLELPPNRWAHHMVDQVELVRDRLAEEWPMADQKVDRANPRAAEALKEVDLATWLAQAAPREPDSQ